MSTSTRSVGLSKLLARLWPHLSPRRRRQFVALMALMIVSAFAEIISMSAVLPFLGVLTSPNWLFSHRWAAELLGRWGVSSPEQLILPLTLAFIAAALFAGAIRVLLLYVSTRVAFASGSDLSIDVYRRTLYQPYHVHVARNSSEVISGITTKVAGSVNVLYNSLTVASSAVSMSAIAVALLLINPLVALTSICVFGAGYALITGLSRRRLRANSLLMANEQTQVVKALQEGLGAIRDVLLEGAQPVYCEVYRKADQPMRRADGNNNFIGGYPRPVMEALGMVLIAGLAFALSRQSGGLAAAIPGLGALAVGAQRLLPALQQGYQAWAGIAANQALLADTLDLLDQPVSIAAAHRAEAPLELRDSLSFREVRFRYTLVSPWVLDGLSLTIPKGARVGIVGSTGSGKSTALDLLMGLLAPSEGAILIDGEPLGVSNLSAWQQTIAHVPQHIFLADSTLAENIAFGVPLHAIDFERLRAAAQQAQIADFIETRVGGYEARVGERGIQLSGGQRQRIGIARALYKRASVLVFDEATSALDNATERLVMESIERLNRNLTIILIAHRLSTVRRCDLVLELAHGKVVDQGTYDQLLERSRSFRHMALAPTELNEAAGP